MSFPSHKVAGWLAPALLLVSACGGGGSGSGGGSGGGGGGGGGGIDPGLVPDLGLSQFLLTPAFGTPADGTTTVAIELRLISLLGRPMQGTRVTLEVSGYANTLAPLPLTDIEGRTRSTLASSAGERKLVRARVDSGGRVTEFAPLTAEFLLIPERTFFVRQSGSDANSGRSPREAWRNLDFALQQAGAGATLHVGAGVYAGPLTLALDSSASTPFVLAGDRSGRMTGDAGPVVIEGGGAPWALRLLASRQVVLQGLTLRGAQTGLHVEAARDVRVLACSAHENDTGLVVAGADLLVVQDCRISANRSDGLRLAGAQRVRLENNLVYANHGCGMLLQAPAEATQIRFNTFYRNGSDHVRELEPGGDGRIFENILSEGGAGAIDLQTNSGYQTSNNLVWGSAPGTSRWTPDGNVEADPMFADPCGPDGILGGEGAEDDDFRLLTDSIALDLGGHLARDIVLASRESLATRTSRLDDLREWSGADLPVTNLGFHAALAEQPFTSLPQGGGRLVHVQPGDVNVSSWAWDRGAPTVLATASAPVVEAEVVYLEQRLSPRDRPEELLGAQVSTGTQGRIVVRHWDGRRWGEPALAPSVEGIAPELLADRRFDLAYENLSGRALFVFADGDGIPSYQVLERGAWSAIQPVGASTPGAGRVLWVELVPHRQSDELALLTLDDQRDLVVSFWNGLEWGAPRRLEANTVYTRGWQPFDGAFESLSGDFLVSWGFNTFIEETRWATFERASGTWRMGQHPSTDAIGAHIVLASDPTSDRIAAAMGEGDFDNDVIVSVWNGGEWVDTAELTLAGPLSNRLLEVCWIGNTGIACTVFRRQGNQGSFNVALLLPTGWRIQPDVVLGDAARASKVRLRSLPDKNQLLGEMLDQQGRLWGLRHDGQTFSLLNDAQPLATGLDPAAPGRAFDAAVRRAAPTGPLLQ